MARLPGGPLLANTDALLGGRQAGSSQACASVAQLGRLSAGEALGRAGDTGERGGGQGSRVGSCREETCSQESTRL